jgi:hypothetical protein
VCGVGKTTPASNRCIDHWRLPNPLGQCHCGQLSLPIAVNSHIDDVGDSLNDGITSRRIKIVDGVTREAAGHSVDELAQKENEVIIGLLKLRANGASAPLTEQEADRAKAII